MKRIALEEHYTTAALADSFRSLAIGFDQETVARLVAGLSDFDSHRLETMDQAGIDISVLSVAGVGVQGERSAATALPHARETNDFLATQIRKHPDYYRGFAHLPLQDPKAAADELARTVREHDFLGALVSGPTHGHYLDEDRFLVFWERVAELNVPLYLHPGTPFQLPQSFQDHPELNGPIWGWTVDTATHALRLVFSGLFDRFPELTIILGHMGETLPLSAELLLCTRTALGEDHILFSVDYPFELSLAAAQFMDCVSVPEHVREKINFKNAQRVLKMTS